MVCYENSWAEFVFYALDSLSSATILLLYPDWQQLFWNYLIHSLISADKRPLYVTIPYLKDHSWLMVEIFTLLLSYDLATLHLYVQYLPVVIGLPKILFFPLSVVKDITKSSWVGNATIKLFLLRRC